MVKKIFQMNKLLLNVLLVEILFHRYLGSAANNSMHNSSTKTWPKVQLRQEPIEINCPLKPKCECDSGLVLSCTNFYDFSELDFKSANISGHAFNTIRLIPLKVVEVKTLALISVNIY